MCVNSMFHVLIQYYVCCTQPELKSYLTCRLYVGKQISKLVSVLAIFGLFDHPILEFDLQTKWNNLRSR